MSEDEVAVEESDDEITVEDLIEAFQSERFADALARRLTASLTPVLENICNKLVEDFSHRLEGMGERCSKDTMTKVSEAQSVRVTALESQNVQLKPKLEAKENSLRMNNLVIYGLAESSTEIASRGESGSAPSTSQKHQPSIQSVLDLCTSRLHLSVSEADISHAYRIPSNGKNLCRPLVVGFVSRRIRDMVYASRKTLRDVSDPRTSAVYINEHLTRLNSQIFAKARGLVKARKISSAWTAGGRVFVRQSGSRSEKPKKITSLTDLDGL